MKKLKFILLLSVLLLMLCSCGWLDEMRSQHAIYYEDGVIQYNDALYKRVNEEETEWLQKYAVDRDKDLYITAPDVPVLLSQFQIVKHPPFINAERTIINDCGNYYILEDRFNEILHEAQKEAKNEENAP